MLVVSAVIRGTHNITGDKFASFDVLFLTVTNDAGLHGDVSLQTRDNVGGLLFLVPTNNGVEHQNTDDNTGIYPILEAESEDCCCLHDIQNRSSEEADKFEQLVRR